MTVQPELLVSFCKCYDLKDHATNIFQDIINSLGAYVQSLLVSQQHMGINGKCFDDELLNIDISHQSNNIANISLVLYLINEIRYHRPMIKAIT